MTTRQTTVKSSIERTVEIKYELAKQEDYQNLLGVSPDDPPEQVRTAYLRWVKMVHPDNLARNGIEHMRDKAALVFKALSAANDIFSDEAKKRAWLASRAGGADSPAAAGPVAARNAEEEAKIALHQSRLLLRRRAWKEAEELLQKFTATYPNDARGQVLLGWSIFQNADLPEKKRLEDARRCWDTAVKADGEDADAFYHLSLYFKATENLTQQEKCLKKAVQLDPSHVSAQREARLLEMRRERSGSPGPESVGAYLRRVWGQLTKKRGKEPEPPAEPEESRSGRSAARRPTTGSRARAGKPAASRTPAAPSTKK
ncbi:MAG: DnaJ domain-containing protein [Deltaproteobacteria bacterium]|nr:DnaJ domain-containing protein [Deltaproteobacteria bacterium]